MLKIDKRSEGKNVELALSGRLDTLTSPELEKTLKPELDGLKKLTFDFSDLEYISSAGLRVLLMAAQAMEDSGEMVVKNVNSDIMDIFEVTGFSDILNIE